MGFLGLNPVDYVQGEHIFCSTIALVQLFSVIFYGGIDQGVQLKWEIWGASEQIALGVGRALTVGFSGEGQGVTHQMVAECVFRWLS